MNENKYLGNQNETMGENSLMKKILKKRLNQKGLTLIELLAVIVILAIIAAIAIPAIGNIINRSEDNGILSEASNILSGVKLANTANACNPALTTVTAPSGGTLGSCDSTNVAVKEYVEGVGSGVTYLVSKTGTTWSVTYSEFANMNTRPAAVASDTTITETELNDALAD